MAKSWQDILLAPLNEPQREAVKKAYGPVLILAGAGSGKTRTIIHRMAWLIHVEKIPPRRIAAVTFTNKAAGEMRTRLLETAGPIGADCQVRTYHSLGLYLLRQNAQYFGYPENFSVWDDEDQLQAITAVMEKFSGKYNRTQCRYFANTISSFKDRLVTPQNLSEAIDLDSYEFGELLPEIYQLYELRKQASFAVDFADLISLPCFLFEKNPELLERWQKRYPFWLIDEYQDTNYAQYRFVQLVAARERNLCVVGDDDQAIYGWRGADVRNILDFARDFPDAAVIKLEENYRSTEVILEIANSVIANNFERMPKRLFTRREGGEKAVLYTTPDDTSEAKQIAQLVRELMREYPAGEIAVLYRTNAQSRLIEEALLEAKIPYRIYGGLSFFARKEIKDVLAYFRLITNSSDEAAFVRAVNLPPRGLGDKSIEKIFTAREESLESDFIQLLLDEKKNPLSGKAKEAAVGFGKLLLKLRKRAESMDLAPFLDELLELTGLRKLWEEEDRLLGSSRLEHVAELRNSLARYQTTSPNPSLADYLQQITLLTSNTADDGNEEGSEKNQAVNLMTVHNAKGLEFCAVIVAGFEEELFPHFLAEQSGDISEERRLFYVAVTRARDRLFFTQAQRRMRQGYLQASHISPFFHEIAEGLVVQKNNNRFVEGMVKKIPPQVVPPWAFFLRPKNNTSGSFARGDRVRHHVFGAGRVLRIEGEGDSALIHIIFDDGKTRKFLLRYTELERLEAAP